VWFFAVLIVVAFFALLSSIFALAITRVPVVRTPVDFLQEIAGQIGALDSGVIVDAG